MVDYIFKNVRDTAKADMQALFYYKYVLHVVFSQRETLQDVEC